MDRKYIIGLILSLFLVSGVGWVTDFSIPDREKGEVKKEAARETAMGVNFNECLSPDFVRFSEIKSSETSWVRGFITFFDLYNQFEKGDDWTNDPRLLTYKKMQDSGYKTVLNIRYMFNRYKLKIPSKNTKRFTSYMNFTDSLLKVLLPKANVIVAGNEPFIGAPKGEKEKQIVVDFYKAVARRIHSYIQSHHLKIPLFIGAFENADEPFRENNPAYNQLLAFAKETNWIQGVDVHIHHTYNKDIRKAMNYISARIRPNQKIIVTEFSLRKWWDLHLKDSIDATFKRKYALHGIDKVWQYLNKALKHPRPLKEWNDWNRMTPWLSSRRHYIQNAWSIFNSYPNFWLAFYSFKLKGPRSFTKKTSGWILNSLLVNNTVQHKANGDAYGRIWYMDDFRAIQ